MKESETMKEVEGGENPTDQPKELQVGVTGLNEVI